MAVLVTNVMPKDMEQFGEKEGIWICSFSEVKALVHVLRDSVLKVFSVMKSQENKGEKMQFLYSYLTSHEFSEQWKAIREGFLSMKHSIDKERDAMEKIWKSREKQLEKVLLNATHIKGFHRRNCRSGQYQFKPPGGWKPGYLNRISGVIVRILSCTTLMEIIITAIVLCLLITWIVRIKKR